MLLEDKQLYGFVIVDLEATPEADKFKRLNYPPIFSRETVEFNWLPKWMQEHALESTFPRSTLVQRMEAKEIFLHTELLAFYLENGYKLTKVHRFIEYEPAKCFSDFYEKAYKLRVKATIEGNKELAAVTKITMNSSKFNIKNLFNFYNILGYGRFIMNPRKFTNTKLKSHVDMNAPLLINAVEHNTCIEVKSNKKSVVEKYPLQVGNTVLHLSKLVLLKTVVFFDKYLKDDSYKLLYSGIVNNIS